MLYICIIEYCFAGLNSNDSGSPCVQSVVGQWLAKLNLSDYESLLLNYGFDDLEFIVSTIFQYQYQRISMKLLHYQSIKD